jgi:UDP-glucose 4-epimerase
MFSLKNRSVLVTGGAGFIGSHLVDRIIKENPARVCIVDNFFLGSHANLSFAEKAFHDLEVIRIDAANFNAVADIARSRNVDSIFDLAVVPLPTSLSYPAWTVESNVSITLTACELARAGTVERLIHFSTSEVYGSARYVPMDESHPHDALTPYAASKSAADQIVSSYVKTFNINATTIRPFNNIGPRQNPGSYAGIIPIVVGRILRNLPIEIYGDGNQSRDFTWVADTAEAAVQIHDVEGMVGQTLNVATGQETSINALVQMIFTAFGLRDYPVVHLPERPGDVRRHCADISALRELLPEACPTPITIENLSETIEWYRRVLPAV